MSKQYKVDLNIDVSKSTPNGGFLIKNVDKSEDERGFKERTGPEVFVFLSQSAIKGANPKCGYEALRGFRRISKMLDKAAESGELVANTTDIGTIKDSIKGNRNWPHSDELIDVLEQIMDKLEKADAV